MTHYYFHICSRSERIEDREGGDFDNLEGAMVEARLAAREMMADDVRRGRMHDAPRRFEIVDEEGRLVARLPFVEAID